MPIRLDQRLKTVADLVDGKVVADIGCDHGKLGYYLLGVEKAKKVIATDISAPSLKKAKELALENGVCDNMETRLGDGLEPVESAEADNVIIAGMGGDLIAKIILSAYEKNKRYQTFILSPNTHAEKVRRTLSEIGHEIIVDDIVFACGKYYTVIKSKEGGEVVLTEKQILLGKFYNKNENFFNYAVRELKNTKAIISKGASSQKLLEKQELLEQAIKEFEAKNVR